MNKLLKRLIVLLVYKIDWRKLFLILTIVTTVGIVLQISLLPFPLSTWLHSPMIRITSAKDFSNSLHLSLRHGKHWPLHQISIPVSLNSPSVLNKRVHSVERKRRRRKKREEEFQIPASPPPPPRSPPTPLQRYVWSLSPKEALLYAKKELKNATFFGNGSDLYAPIFKNVSNFQRSYELMELILKVYVYPDGRPPIFHEPHLSGIYASEGWFMKLLEGNRQFVTRNPEMAHLFYLPYSARQLQQALYVQGSHNLAPLSLFIRDYVNLLAAKYPFWNRTRGADHFLVACHDWGPYTLKAHKELVENSIKAVCNADLSEGIFKAGKDVSLPETTIRVPRKPLRNIGGGMRVSQRPILAFFAGNMHGRVRPLLLQHWHNKDESMRIYGPLPHRVSKQISYIQHMKSSKFCLCPMGYEVNSPRIVEAIYYECVPVIIADNFVPPFDDVLDWSAFSVTVAEEDIPKLKEILEAIPLKRYLKMLQNLKMLQRHFFWNSRPIKYDLFHMILHSIWHSRLNQIQIPD
ncbi:probable glycosyltransferase At5g03795 [Chenopodium quinoa]|uniref:Exostosin GT47 domain-containing protein n=1 Tax=Chenopodium quinoa TaxID=63459 RepID=A0A803L5H1_CHEQI|nr:probable glycosyltransferase At5g03795 [Chenopodium quinoa]